MYEIMLCVLCFVGGLIFGYLRGTHVAYRDACKIMEDMTSQVSEIQKQVNKSF